VGEGSDGGTGKKSGGKAKLPALRQAANDSLSQRQILSRDARLLVVGGIERLIKDQRLSVRAACQQLCDWVKAGEVAENVITTLALGHSKSGLIRSRGITSSWRFGIPTMWRRAMCLNRPWG